MIVRVVSRGYSARIEIWVMGEDESERGGMGWGRAEQRRARRWIHPTHPLPSSLPESLPPSMSTRHLSSCERESSGLTTEPVAPAAASPSACCPKEGKGREGGKGGERGGPYLVSLSSSVSREEAASAQG